MDADTPLNRRLELARTRYLNARLLPGFSEQLSTALEVAEDSIEFLSPESAAQIHDHYCRFLSERQKPWRFGDTWPASWAEGNIAEAEVRNEIWDRFPRVASSLTLDTLILLYMIRTRDVPGVTGDWLEGAAAVPARQALTHAMSLWEIQEKVRLCTYDLADGLYLRWDWSPWGEDLDDAYVVTAWGQLQSLAVAGPDKCT